MNTLGVVPCSGSSTVKREGKRRLKDLCRIRDGLPEGVYCLHWRDTDLMRLKGKVIHCIPNKVSTFRSSEKTVVKWGALRKQRLPDY